MIPVLFRVFGIPIYSFGLMLGIGFLIGSTIMTEELKRKKINPEYGGTITLLAVIFGISGAKVLSLLENWDAFLRNPIGEAFSPGGLTWYGGFVLGMAAVTVYVRRKKIPWLKVWDSLGMGLPLAYGVARIGCHLSGDGDYGFPTTLPWGTDYSNGVYPPQIALKAFSEITSQFPGGVIPAHILCHPTPVYETILGIIGFVVLWNLRKRPWPDGKMFAIYVSMSAAFRFGVEYLRLNPRLALGLSEAQLIAVPLFFAGIAATIWLDRRARRQPA